VTAAEFSATSVSAGRRNSGADLDEEIGNSTTTTTSRKEGVENKDLSPSSKDDDFPVNSSSSHHHLDEELSDTVSLDVHGQYYCIELYCIVLWLSISIALKRYRNGFSQHEPFRSAPYPSKLHCVGVYTSKQHRQL